jgi:hypothetical protein
LPQVDLADRATVLNGSMAQGFAGADAHHEGCRAGLCTTMKDRVNEELLAFART